MLVIPYIAPNGDTLQIRFRRLAGEGPKFRTMPGDKPRPYNTASLERHSLDLWITEGEPDTWVLQELGIPSCAIPGATVWHESWKYIFQPYRFVYVPFDGDDAGRKFGRMIVDKVSNARPIDMGTFIDDEGVEKSHDVNSYWLVHGDEATLRKVGAK